MKIFKTFDEMARYMKVLTVSQVKMLDKLKVLSDDIEEIDGYAGINANSLTEYFLRVLLVKHKNIHVITETIEDGDKDVTYHYSLGFSRVNRERYFLCRKSLDFEYYEIVECGE